VNPKVQEAIDSMLDQKAALVKDYNETKKYIHLDPAYAFPILFDIEEEMEELNMKYKLLIDYVQGSK
jgi:hypothetical protein